MELIKSKDSKYDEYEALLLERDQVKKEAGSAWTWYVQTFGQLIADVYEVKLECVKCKKTIAYYQAALNKGEAIDAEAMRQYLDREMASYYANLKRMQDEHAQCRDLGQSTSYEIQRAKELYRRLAKLLHPDINPETDRQEALMELWQRVVIAYGHNNVKELSELEVLVRRTMKELGAGAVRVEVPDIEEKIEALKGEIEEITHTEPYTYRDQYEEQEAVDRKQAELNEELASYRKYREELEAAIDEMEKSGGIRFLWRMS